MCSVPSPHWPRRYATWASAVAYALWGGFGVLATAAAGALLFGQRLDMRAGLGLLILCLGMGLLKFG